MQHRSVAYVRYFAYATHKCCIRELCRVCNRHVLRTRNMLRMQQIFTKRNLYQKGLDEIFFKRLDFVSCMCGLYQTDEKPIVMWKTSWWFAGSAVCYESSFSSSSVTFLFLFSLLLLLVNVSVSAVFLIVRVAIMVLVLVLSLFVESHSDNSQQDGK